MKLFEEAISDVGFDGLLLLAEFQTEPLVT